MGGGDRALALPGRDEAESEIVRSLVSSLDRFCARNVRAMDIDRDKSIPREVLDGLAEIGAFGVSIPEEWGGFGLSLNGVCSTVSALARYDRSVATTAGLHLGLGTRGLVAFGSDLLRERYLPRLASGRSLAAFATTESGAGSDLTAIRTVARPKGDGLEVHGSKVFVTNGGLAEIFTITASTPGLGGARRGHSMLLLEQGDDGIEVAGEEHKLGLRGSSTTSLHLDDLQLPMERIIGAPGQGMIQLAHVLAWGRTAMAAGCVGAGRAGLSLVLEQVSTREQFGKPIGSFEVVRGQVADIFALHFAMEALVRRTAAAEDDRPLLAARSTAAKVFCSEGAGEIADMAIQLHGGSGYIEETGVALLLRDGRITRIFEGPNDVLLAHAGLGAFTAPSIRQPLGAVAGANDAGPVAGAPDAGPVADEMATGATALREALKNEHGIRGARLQREMHRLGRLFVLQEACDAAVLRARAEGSGEARDLAAHFVDFARDRAAMLRREQAPRERIESISDRLYERGSA